MAEINDLDTTDASNTARWPEGMTPSSVNDSSRALEGLLARAHEDQGARKSSTGSGAAYLFAAAQTLSAYYDGLIIGFDANFTNTGAATLNVDSVSADPIKKHGGQALVADDIQAGQKVIVVHDGTNWQMVTPATTAGVPQDYINGLELSNGTDATNDIDIAVGAAADLNNILMMVRSSVLVKRLDAAWEVGTGNGGRDTGSIADGVWHLWLIARSDTGVVDALFSLSATTPTLPGGGAYDRRHRIGAVHRVSGTILAFTQEGDEILLDIPLNELDSSDPGTSAVPTTVTVPTGIRCQAILSIYVRDATASAVTHVLVTSPHQADPAPSSTVFTFFVYTATDDLESSSGVHGLWRVNTSAQIRTRIGAASTADHVIRITCHGWIDPRGRNT